MSEGGNRVYLAGPEVFLDDAVELFETKKAICAEAGLQGVSPFDNEVGGMDGGAETALAIYRGNLAAMESAAFAIANVTPFRGVSLDAGTAFEIGFMRALKKPVFAYSAVPVDYATRTREAARENAAVAADGAMAVEDFGLLDNLMIQCGVEEGGGRIFVSPVPLPERFRDLSLFTLCVGAIAAMRAKG